MVALFGHGGQGDLRAGRSGGRSCGAGAVSVIADGDGVGGGGNNAVFPQRLDLCVPAHGIGIAYLVLRAANLPSLELLIGGSGEAADGQDVICLCLDDHGTHAAAAAVAAEGDCAIRKRRTLTHSDFRIGAGKVVVILRIADEVIASGQVINLRAAARRIASFACHTVFHLISHAADFAVAAAHGDGRDTDQAVRSFPRGFADAPRCGHGIGAAVHPFAGLGCDANGVIARVRAGVAGDVHSSEIIAVHGRGMHRAVIGICSRYADVGLCGIGGHGRCVLLEDSLDLHVVVRHEELVVLDGHAAADDLPLLEAVALVGRGGQGDFRAGHGFCMRCGSRSVPVRSHGDGKFGGRGRCIFLEDGFNLHVGTRHSELIVLDGHAAAHDLPLLEVVALVGRSGQGDLRAGRGFCIRCGSRSVSIRSHGDGVLGCGGLCADGEVVLRLAAVVSRAVQRHLGSLFAVKALVARCEGVGMDVVGIDGGVVRVLRKLLRFVLARLMGKPRQLLFAAVMGAVRQPLERQKPMLIAVSKIILVAERAFAVLVRAMVNGLSVDGAAADGDVFRRNTGQLLCVQLVIDIVCAVLFLKPEGFHRAVQNLNLSNL